jgi:hypothetical protein
LLLTTTTMAMSYCYVGYKWQQHTAVVNTAIVPPSSRPRRHHHHLLLLHITAITVTLYHRRLPSDS